MLKQAAHICMRQQILTRFLRIAILLLLAGFLEAAQRPKPAGPADQKRVTSSNPDRRRVLSAHPLGMYYYYDDSLGLESLSAHAAEMTLLGPQCFFVDADGTVRGGVSPQVAEIARRAGLPLMPLVVNPGFGRPGASKMLRSAKLRERAVTYLAYLAKRDNYAGFQLDLEYIDPADKALYTRFVERAAARLHARGRLLSVAVVPRFSDTYPDRSLTREFHTGEWGAPYDYRALGRIADFITLMTYDHHGSATPPGPVAGYEWQKAALDYAVMRIPRAKLLLGIPFYGREWVETPQGTTSSSLAFKDVKPLLERPDAKPRWDERWRTTWLQFREGATQHTAWFDDQRSLREKLQLMKLYHLRGFAAWRLGVEDPQFWPMAAEFKQTSGSFPSRLAKKRGGAASGRPASHSR
jgi:spore germination protein YaaH